MIGTLMPNGTIVFDLDIQSPFDWIDCLWDAFPNDKWYVGCYGQYENCLWK